MFLELYGEKKTRFPPTVIPRVMSNAVASQVSMEYGLDGCDVYRFDRVFVRKSRHRPRFLARLGKARSTRRSRAAARLR